MNKEIIIFSMKHQNIPGKILLQAGLKPMPLTIWVSTLTTRPPMSPVSWHPHPRAYERLDQGLDLAMVTTTVIFIIAHLCMEAPTLS